MNSLIDVLTTNSTSEEIARGFQEYRNFLAASKDRFPASAYDFASAPWHYDYGDHRCPHDSWVESLVIREPATGTRNEVRAIEISVSLLGAFHDGHMELRYDGVQSYSLGAKKPKNNIGPGDWLADQISLSEQNNVVHEILFSGGSGWKIEAKDIRCEWIPIS